MLAVRSARTILAAGTVLLACAPAAAAQSDGRAGVYGGGAIRDYLHFVSVHVRPDGGFDANATLITKCAPRFGDEMTESILIRDRQLSPGGRYRATTSFSDEIAPGVPTVGGLRAEGTIAFSALVRGARAAAAGGARAAAGGRASGFARVRTTYRDPDTGEELSRCDTGRIPWVARRPPRDAGLGRPGPGAGSGTSPSKPHVLRGVTGQDEPFLMRVTDRGRLVRRAGLTVQVGCPSGVGLGLDVVAHRARVRGGRFGARDEFRRPFTHPNGTRLVEHYSWALRGRFGERGARGTFQLRGVVRRRTGGQQVGTCTTGSIAWRAMP
jgi:hypothetical protein